MNRDMIVNYSLVTGSTLLIRVLIGMFPEKLASSPVTD